MPLHRYTHYIYGRPQCPCNFDHCKGTDLISERQAYTMEKHIVSTNAQHTTYQRITNFHTENFFFYYRKRPHFLWKVTSLSATMGTQHRGKRRPIRPGTKFIISWRRPKSPTGMRVSSTASCIRPMYNKKIPRHVWQGILNFSGNNNKGTRVCAQASYREIAPEGHASAQVPHSVHSSGLIEYFSPSEMAPTGHSSIHVPQATQSSPIT